MPWKLRKAPRKELYWVVAKDTGKHMSKDPLPIDRAKAQMRALYAQEDASKKGGAEPGVIETPFISKDQAEKLIAMLPKDKDTYTDLPDEELKNIVSIPGIEQWYLDLPNNPVVDKALSDKITAEIVKSEAEWEKAQKKLKAKVKAGLAKTAPALKEMANDTYADYVNRIKQASDLRATYDPVRKQGMDEWKRLELEIVARRALAHEVLSERNPAYREVYSRFDDEGNMVSPYVTTMPIAIRNRELYFDKQQQAKDPVLHWLNKNVFGPAVSGLTKVADFVVENLGDMLPGVGQALTTAYKAFAPPGSQYYKEGTLAEKAVGALMGQGATHRQNVLKRYNLKDKSYSIKQLAKISSVPEHILQEVYNRGVGAYKTQPKSVRLKGSFVKNVDAPMSKKLSKEQWGYARVYSFIDGNPEHDNDLRANKEGEGKPGQYSDFAKSIITTQHNKKNYEKMLDLYFQAKMLGMEDRANQLEKELKQFKKFNEKEAERFAFIEIPKMGLADEWSIPTKKGRGYEITKEGSGYIVRSTDNKLQHRKPVSLTTARKHLGMLRRYEETNGALQGSGFFDTIGKFAKKGFEAVKKGAKTVVERAKTIFMPMRNAYRPKIRSWLEKNGEKVIKRLTVARTPIQSGVDILLEAVTLGKWKEAKKKVGYDKMFHLALLAEYEGGRAIIEKNEVINISQSYKATDETEYMEVPLDGKQITFNEFLAKGEKAMGDKYFRYHALENNCQDYIMALLKASGLATAEITKFVKQPVEQLVKELPGYTGKVAKTLTDIAGKASEVIEGRGMFKGKTIADQLKLIGFDPADYLAKAKARAKEAKIKGELKLDDDGIHKLIIITPDNKEVHFGRRSYGDFLIWSHLEKQKQVDPGYAKKKQENYQKRSGKIKGDWSADVYSPNNLARKILW
jgi:hypothetical protein